jgi:hypothetical protein
VRGSDAVKAKMVVPPTLPGEVWRGQVDLGGRKALCAVALPDTDVPRWTYLEFGSHWPTVAEWFVSAGAPGDWLPLDESEQGFVYAACIRALRETRAAKETG